MKMLFILFSMHALILIIFYGFYRIILSRETYFQLNRAVLLAGILASVILPFFRPTYVVNLEMTTPVSEPVPMAIIPVEEAVVATSSWTDNLWMAIFIAYVLVSLVLLYRWLRQVYDVYTEARQEDRIQLNGIQVVNTKKYPSPFSFFHLTFVDLQRYEEKDCSSIIAHEKAHVEQQHWIDLLLIQLLGIVVWINPIIRWYEKAMKENHEFLADAAVLNKGVNRQQYQALLLQQMLGNPPITIVSYLFNHQHKNRFQMMNQKRSRILNRLKVAGILPLLALALLAFAQPVYNTVATTAVSNEVTTNLQEEITVKGKVTDSKTGKTITAASIVIVNTTSGTVSDRSGDFMIKMPAGATLAISYVGYQTVKVQVEDETSLEVKLTPKYHAIQPVDTPKKEKKSSSGKKKVNGEVFQVVESMPYYQDQQNDALFKQIQFEVQKHVSRTGEKGTVTVHFTVNRAGQLENVYTHESTNPKLNKAAEDIIRGLKNWKPGKQRGKAVDTGLELTLEF
jgi:TonB family protein